MIKLNDFEKSIVESMRYENKNQVTLPGREKILINLHSLKSMTTGQANQLFCNTFLNEIVQLLINSIFLYEDGLFDCAFYSIRQASEVGNNMLYLANKEKSNINEWNAKGYFPTNRKIINELLKIDSNYSEIQDVIPIFFEEHERMTKKAHKIIHKQGFDTFYGVRCAYQFSKETNINYEKEFFIEFLKYSIGMAIILFIVVDPISLVLADDDLSVRFNFDPMTERADVEFFKSYLNENIITKIKSTSFFTDISSYFINKERMLPSVFDVVRNQAFDIDSLDEIKSQEHLISLYERIILDILMADVKLSKIYPDCNVIGYYFTSIRNNCSQSSWSSLEYKKYLNYNETFNESYCNVYRSILKGVDDNWILEHNSSLSKKEIELVKSIIKNYREAYEELVKSAY